MRRRVSSLLPIAGWILFHTTVAFAQEEGPKSAEVANAMGVHTWFVIGSVGALLAWCISYALQTQKEAEAQKHGRNELIRKREQILDNITELESQRESGAVTESKYRREFKELRLQLSRVIEQLGSR